MHPEIVPGDDTNLDDAQAPLVGRTFPVSLALVGLAFMVCGVLVAGLPPLSGFVAKLALLTAVLTSEGDVTATAGNVSSAGWMVIAFLLLAGFASTVSFARAAIRNLWATGRRGAPILKATEAAAVLTLLLSCVLLTVFAEPALRYTRAAAAQLHTPQAYVDAVLSTRALPRATDAPAGEPAP